MFKIFTFGFDNVFNPNNIEKISGIMHSFLDNFDINEFAKNNENISSNEGNREEYNNFIKLNRYDDMYHLTIDLKGIDLRELSIRYDPGILDINLNRLEIKKSGFGIFSNTALVKNAYNKRFNDIEDIDTNQILKSIDNGVLSIIMQKKYSLENTSNIIDVDSYQDDADIQ
ncbi:Hsp20/alpha crystallin family protein [Clostridium beijerinckii]|uniref:Hsp20 family protein n=3 Tax=Clostridium TaxID=1485 RepID=A0A1S8RQ12_CLOBE|nr:Hsp20/alpha crystallin family protein [Clostridium beijerinckii]MBA8932208.1 HSP20 family protein [Clostridium beijerinckii]NMF06594.1 Hsp20 family protein [Clostridium beijerinckii]NRT32134.1 HSP20 family protein [Clostridium beijerinckii]NRT48438.1 HSP20 family protein [Clostridium beijerinckii]NRT74487.1 HSP20 family protein [Clostridium beijerinckii]